MFIYLWSIYYVAVITYSVIDLFIISYIAYLFT
jgi:hypothetical protein